MELQVTSPYSPHRPRLALLAGLLLVLLIVFAVSIHTVTENNIPGADFYTFWVAGRALFLHGTDPYSQSVTEQAQMGKLGRLAEPNEDQMAYAYPPYGLFSILPLIFLPIDWAVSFWLAFNILAFLSTCFYVLPPPVRSFSLISLLAFPIFLNFILGTFDILLGVGILIFFGLIVAQNRRSLPLQGFTALLLAWGTMKPQFIWLVLLLCVAFAIRERLIPFLVTFFASLALFFGLSFWLVPGWIGEWTMRVQEYARYVNGQPTLSEFLRLVMATRPAYLLTGAAFVICMALTLYLLVRWWKGELHWFKLLAWVSMLTYLFHLHGISYEQLIFLLPLILWPGLKGGWRSLDVIGFWTATLVISWMAFVTGMNNVALDRAPVLFNMVWVGWLLFKPRFQL